MKEGVEITIPEEQLTKDFFEFTWNIGFCVLLDFVTVLLFRLSIRNGMCPAYPSQFQFPYQCDAISREILFSHLVSDVTHHKHKRLKFKVRQTSRVSRRGHSFAEMEIYLSFSSIVLELFVPGRRGYSTYL